MAQPEVNLNCVSQQLDGMITFHISSFALQLNSFHNGLCDLVGQRIENDFFEDFETLVMQLWDTMHFNVELVEVLEESLHPLDHDLVVLPLAH